MVISLSLIRKHWGFTARDCHDLIYIEKDHVTLWGVDWGWQQQGSQLEGWREEGGSAQGSSGGESGPFLHRF